MLVIAFAAVHAVVVDGSCCGIATALMSSSRCACPVMGGYEWLRSVHEEVPLVHLPMADGLLLPGEAQRIFVDKAESLHTLEAAQDGCIAALISTPQANALATAPLLEVRGIRRKDVGVVVDVTAVGRIKLGRVAYTRGFSGHDITPVCDVAGSSDKEEPPEVEQMISELRCAAELNESLERKITQQGAMDSTEADEAVELVDLAIDQAAAAMREELCVVDMDRAPATSLERLYGLWGVEDEASAELQLLSFAACTSLSSVQRAMAMGMDSTAERLRYARRCLLKQTKKKAALLAIEEALAT